MAKKAYEESNIANIAVAIREKTGENKTYKTSEMPNGVKEAYDSGYEDGYSQGDSDGYGKGYDDGLIDGGNSCPPDYLPCTTKITIDDWNLFNRKVVVLNIPLVTAYGWFLQQKVTNTTVEHLTINGSQDGGITGGMNYGITGTDDNTLKKLTLNCDFSNVTSFNSALGGFTALEVIDGMPIDFSSSNNNLNMFKKCSALKELRVTPLSIKYDFIISVPLNLSDISIQSIIDGLADLTDSDTQTLTLHADAGAKLTDEQKVTITAKNWTLAY